MDEHYEIRQQMVYSAYPSINEQHTTKKFIIALLKATPEYKVIVTNPALRKMINTLQDMKSPPGIL